MRKKRLGELLSERGHISHADLTRAIKEQQVRLVHLGELMLERGFVSKQNLSAALAEVTRVPYVDCDNMSWTPKSPNYFPMP